MSASATTIAATASVRNLHVSLTRDGVRSEVLRGVDLEIAPGEIVGLVGESGSGKSVLSLALLGLLPEKSAPQLTGSIEVAGTDMVHGTAAELRAVRRGELGAIFQDPMTSLNPTMRIGKQLTEVTHDRDEAVRLLETVGIRDATLRLSAYPHELSGGLRQRVMAAIAVSGRPSLIIADEPTTALDVTVQAQVLDLLRELRDDFGCSVLMITHDLGVAAQIADRLVVLYAGRIAEIGTAAAVLGSPSHPYTVGLLGARLSLGMPRHGTLVTLPAETGSTEERMRGCAYHTRCPLATAQCGAEQPALAVDVSGSTSALRACWATAGEVAELAATIAATERTPIELSMPDLDAQASAIPQPAARQAPTTASSAVHPPASADEASTTELAVDLRDLECTFRPKGARRSAAVRALQGVSLSVARGESLAIVGESGSGKSTLLRIVAGLTKATGGTVTLGPGGAQMVFQDAGSSLTPWLTVGETLRERLAPLRLGRASADARVEQTLEAIGLPVSVSKARPADLSGGQRQRVVLARATIIPPAVLLCDEPTSALDASLAASVLNLIREMRERLSMTVLFVTHDLSVARLMGDRIAVMSRGRLVEVGPADRVISAPEDPYTAALIAAVPDINVPALSDAAGEAAPRATALHRSTVVAHAAGGTR